MNNKEIEKPETRYFIFVSSPFEPNWIRSLAQQSIVLAGHVPYLYEQRTQVSPTLDAIHDLIDDSQIYILLLGHRLGSRPHKNSPTYTELEFNYALSKPNIKIITLYQNKTEVEDERAKIANDPEEKKNERDFWEFYNRISQHQELMKDKRYIHAPWSSKGKEALSARITATVNKVASKLDELPTPVGWIRATNTNTQADLVKQMDNEIRVEIVRKFNQFEKLDERCKVEKESKKAIANKIHEVFIPIIIDNKYSL